ncbi:MAG: GNAT family N-acetyltransferase [Candidatus Eremiobacterota bacterium]
MLIELDCNSFDRVEPLYRRQNHCFPLILAVIQKKQKGQVFVDRRETPLSAVVITDFGFMYFMGEDENEEFNQEFIRLLEYKIGIKHGYLLWYYPSDRWQQRLEAISASVRKRARMRFDFRKERANYLNNKPEVPDNFELKHLDYSLIPKTTKLGINITSRFWSSAEDLLENGLSVCLVKNDEVVSICYAACISDDLAEIDIATQYEYGGMGLATFVAQQFIIECLKNGITPTWDCFDTNVPSLKLAEKLGFVFTITYPFYTFNIPFKII